MIVWFKNLFISRRKVRLYQYNLKFSIAYSDPTTFVSAYSVIHGEQTFFIKPDKKFNGNKVIFRTDTLDENWQPIAASKKKQLH